MTEIHWQEIPGYEGLYEVSTDGRVRSIDRMITDSLGRSRIQKGMPKKPWTDDGGYERVELCKNGRRSGLGVNRLVALTFLPPPLPGQIEVRHLDCNPGNNRVENLSWGTHSENVRDTIRLGRYRNGNSYKTECANGHPYTHRNNRGDRVCRICLNRNARKYQQMKRIKA
jgi:hypothetical protein